MNGHGGKRAGSGAKKKLVAEAIRNWAAKILPDEEEDRLWRALLQEPKHRADALRFLSEHKHGRAPQSVEVTGADGGPIEHCIRFVASNEKPGT